MKLFPYQLTGINFLAGLQYALLADGMGLGKTAQAIVAADKVNAGRILVLCPAIVRINWQREFAKFSMLRRDFSIISTGKSVPSSTGVTICSYELARTPWIQKQLLKMDFDLLIMDEAHYLKNRTAKRTTAVLGVNCKGENGLISRAKRAWALTGTPTPNHPGEIYPLLRAFRIWKENYFAFEARFVEMRDGDYGQVAVGAKNMPELKALVKPMMLRRKTEDVLKDLPPITYSDIVLSPDGISNPEDIAEWKEREKQDGDRVRALLTKLQATDTDTIIEAERALADLFLPTLRRVTGLAKVRPIYELVSRELDSGLDKIVIFAIHRDVLLRLRDLFAQRNYHPVLVFGGNSPEVKQERIDSFTTKFKHRVFLGQIQAAGTGIDGLQNVCADVLIAEASWNPAENAQAVMRVRRMGQKRPVRCRFASLANSLDEAVTEVTRRKTEMISQLLD